jgi:hypothetical protein
MSLILDALKKLDREKAFIRKVTANIADEILKTDLPRSEKKFWLYFAAVAFAALAAAAITYAVMSGGFLSKSTPPATLNSARLSQQVQTAPVASEPVRETPEEIGRVSRKAPTDAERRKPLPEDSQPAPRATAAKPPRPSVESAPVAQGLKREASAAAKSVPAKVRNDEEAPQPAAQDSPPDPGLMAAKQATQRAEAAPVTAEAQRGTREGAGRPTPKTPAYAETQRPLSSADDKKTERNIAPEKAKVPVDPGKTIPSSTESRAGSAAQSLRLTGIVWSEAPSDRCAVINGAIVSEGALIQGIKVEEILPNRVRLSEQGRIFEIRLF